MDQFSSMMSVMGRLLLLLLFVAAVVLLWKAYGPYIHRALGLGSNGGNGFVGVGRGNRRGAARPVMKGPDDDEEFLWRLERDRFKQRRAEEDARKREEEQARRRAEREQRGVIGDRNDADQGALDDGGSDAEEGQ
ncbi:hypothetical protein CARG_00995 [Corynebacterium argentoratense DSM 44202]|uniref:Uncharacterized protein n=2 Tax=Corynebacterium argentoratense TaxID=42817 RepID=U3GWP0_9CORY|nr:hypothetical protein CARG_00995 [Corynebacterium argentoratense DSM 44202]